MWKTGRVLGLVLALSAGAALAHQGVQNKAVMARMNAMDDIRAATATLGQMAKGAVPFNAAAAAEAKALLLERAGQTPVLFKAPETDPKSEALPAIWENWSDFKAKSAALVSATEAADVSSAQAIGTSLARIGATCGACHENYRLKK